MVDFNENDKGITESRRQDKDDGKSAVYGAKNDTGRSGSAKSNGGPNGGFEKGNPSLRYNGVGDNGIRVKHATDSDYRGMSEDYFNLQSEYLRKKGKEVTGQVIGTLISAAASSLDLILFYFIYKVLEMDIPLKTVGFLTLIFMMLFAITIIALYQNYYIYKWNKSVNELINNGQHGGTLVKSQETFLEKANVIKILIVASFIMCLLFFFVFIQTTINIPLSKLPPPKRKAAIIYKFLRQITFYIVLIYTIFEIYQYLKWTHRINRFKRLERIIKDEIPEFDMLERLIEEENGENAESYMADNDVNQTRS